MSGTGLRVFIVAGEPSGDLLGGRLMAALRERLRGDVVFAGLGGERMADEGLDSPFSIDELAVMGLLEVLPRAPQLLRRIAEMAARARAFHPDVLITIDSPGFTFRLAERLKAERFPKIHYVAPQAWAWRPKRAAKLHKLFDHMLALLPFEPDWFKPYGIATTFVGHSVIEGGAGHGDGPRFRLRHGMQGRPLLVVLPGSRRGELNRHLPVFRDTVALLRRRRPELAVVLPTLSHLAPAVTEAAKGWADVILTGQDDKFDAFAAADIALAASGTVALELALARTPHVVAYRVNPLTAAIARRLLTVRYVNLMNLVLDRPVVPELLQEHCNAQELAAALDRLADGGPARAAQIGAAEELAAKLGAGGTSPSLRAADAVLATIGYRRR